MLECAKACDNKHSAAGRVATAATCDKQLISWCSTESRDSIVFEGIKALQPLR